jgi:hypothetical protein
LTVYQAKLVPPAVHDQARVGFIASLDCCQVVDCALIFESLADGIGAGSAAANGAILDSCLDWCEFVADALV